METHIQETFLKASEVELESTLTQMVMYMRDNGIRM